MVQPFLSREAVHGTACVHTHIVLKRSSAEGRKCRSCLELHKERGYQKRNSFLCLLARFVSLLRANHKQALADKWRATYRHSMPSTPHTKTMDIACSLHLLLYVPAATDRRLGHHSHTLIDTGCLVWCVSRHWRTLQIQTLVGQISAR